MLVRIFSGYDCHWQTITNCESCIKASTCVFQCSVQQSRKLLSNDLFLKYIYCYYKPPSVYVYIKRCDSEVSNNVVLVFRIVTIKLRSKSLSMSNFEVGGS